MIKTTLYFLGLIEEEVAIQSTRKSLGLYVKIDSTVTSCVDFASGSYSTTPIK